MFSAGKLLTLIDGLGGIVWEADPATFQFSFVSAEAERVLGYPTSAWLEPHFWQRHTHPDDVERCTLFCAEATDAGRDHVFEYRMIAADGRTVWLRDIVSVLVTPDGRRLVGIALDITAQKDDEAEKRQLSRVYEALIENSSDNIALLSEDGTTVYQSEAVERQIGYTTAELLGRNNFVVIHPDDVDTALGRFREMFQSENVVGPVRFRARHKQGHWVVLETVGKRFVSEGGTPFAVINTRDITEVVETQEALEAAQHQLAHAMKMEAVGRLAGGVAHDFNNLLTVIAGYAELVAATLDPSDSRAGDLDEIKRAAQRASLLTRQLLAFSRKQVLRPEVLELNAVVRDVGVLVQRLVGEDIQLVVDTSAEPLPVLADRSQLEQVLMNLAVNARDAMALGGTLFVTTSAEGDAARLSVRDTGTGIAPGVLGRMFEPFFTTKELGKGTGLGLATVYGIVKQSGGDIQVTSEVGVGTEFTITLPLARQQGAADEPADVPGGDETVLLVEDDKHVRELVDQVLTRLGYTVFIAHDAAGAMELCKLQKQRIALLLTDIVMPHISGPEVYKRVSMVRPGIAVLYMSGYTGDKVFARGVDEAAVGFLQKPFTPAALAAKVREVLDEADRTRRTG